MIAVGALKNQQIITNLRWAQFTSLNKNVIFRIRLENNFPY